MTGVLGAFLRETSFVPDESSAEGAEDSASEFIILGGAIGKARMG